METFIEGVRLQPCIWNPSHPDYRETHIKDEAWHRVVEHYNKSSIPNIGLRIGAEITEAHRYHCGTSVDRQGHHGLSCRRSAGRQSRHASINNVIRRALATVNVPATLEPNGIARDDGRRPDGMTLIPWSRGRPLVWDATCVDTLAASHLTATSKKARAAAAHAETSKRRKYECLGEDFIFLPFAVEILGPWGPDAKALYKDVSKRLVAKSNDPRAGAYFGQRISLAIQRVHAAKTEWKKLRDNHRDALKRAKLGRNKLLPAHITTWKYAKAMQFLEPHMKYRITENIEMDPPIESTHSTKTSDHDITTSEVSETPQAGVACNQPPPKRRCPDRNEFRHDTDALESFFNCILTSTKTMPDWMQTQVKKKIFAVIIEAEEYLSSQRPCVTKNEQPDSLLVEHKIKTEVYTDDSCDNDY